MGHVLASLEVKPGYGVYATDFLITKNTPHSPQDKIWLLIAQTDNLNTSACLITPQQVSFLLNGKGRRPNVLMDPGPQMPTNVTGMLKYGTNLLQVVGQFNGHYLILVAFMSHKSLPENPVIPDYVQPAVTSLSADIFLDRNMVEVLKNVGDNVTEVVISADGSWKAVFKDDDNVDKMQNDAQNSGKEPAEPKESTCSPGVLPDVLDLTNGDDMEIMDAGETIDRKPHQADLPCESTTPTLTSLGMNSAGVNQDVAALGEDDFWPRVHVASDGSDTPTVVGNCVHHVRTDAISQATNQEAVDHSITLTSNSTVQNQFSAPNYFQMQQSNYLNSAVNEHVRSQQIPRHVNRNPVAVQALPAQSQASGPQKRSRTNLNPLITVSSTVAPHVSVSSPANVFSPILSDTERQQHFSRPTMNLPQLVGATVSVLQRHSATQSRAPQMANASVPSQPANSYNTSSFLRGFQNAHLQLALNSSPIIQSNGQSTSAVRSSRPHVTLGGSQSGIGQATGTPANGHPTRDMNAGCVSRQPAASLPIQNQTPREHGGNVREPAQSLSRPDGSFNLQSESDWRPAGRMRGSLTGRQYSDAVRQLIIEPTQSSRSARTLGPQSVRPSSVSHHPK